MAEEKIFNGKTALVTGSGRGIGKAIALELAKNGTDVVINFFRNRKNAEETASEIEALGVKALVVKANIGDLEQIDNLFDQIDQEFGKLDIFVSNAASGYNRPAMEQKPKGWDWTMNINARAFLFASQNAVKLMRKAGGGSIVAITSPGSIRVLPDYVMVGASKAALESLTRYLAIELAEENIVVNAVSPGAVATDALNYFNSLSGDDILEKLRAGNPVRRMVTPEDVAGVVKFLCSPEAFMIRGQVITVDGGETLLTANPLKVEKPD